MSSAAIVYLLCLLVSAACGLLLVRTYLRQPTPLLLWSAICFVLLALNNLLVVGDIVLFPGIDLRPWRTIASLGAVSVLLYGFIWEVD